MVGDEPVGMTVGSFTAVSLEPPLVSMCIINSSATWPRLRTGGALGISVLGEDQAVAGQRLAARTGDRFDGVPWEAAPSGAVFVKGAVARLDCALHSELPAGDHLIALLTIRTAEHDPGARPLIFHRRTFRALAPDALDAAARESALAGALPDTP
ncbi:flavin reductase [Streptomyces triticirhizae]|uniref:Flavin reductase n=2 Tax=Streptomyces triticirhizae TaxID=2483353 RepID=A0A3M2LQ32_9ACTN|nr:flavin reductase [Streptomyces triticirhizae]